MQKILIVEDEELIMKRLQFTIDWTKLGCVVCATAANGREGIEKIREHSPDIVITDIRMPHVSGIEMLEATHGEYEYETIIMSGYEEFSYAKSAISLGVSQYLLKPVDDKEIEESILDINKKIEERRQLRMLQSTKTESPMLVLPDEELAYSSKRVNKMVQFIQEHYAEKISIKDLSDIMDLSVAHLHNTFRQNTNYTFNDFLNRYRVQKAVQYMQETDMKIYEIAQAVGIPDYKYFNHVFKKYTGWPPSKFVHSEE